MGSEASRRLCGRCAGKHVRRPMLVGRGRSEARGGARGGAAGAPARSGGRSCAGGARRGARRCARGPPRRGAPARTRTQPATARLARSLCAPAESAGRVQGECRESAGGVQGGCGARLVLLRSRVVVALRPEVARGRRAVAPGLRAVAHAHAQALELLLEAVRLVVPGWASVGAEVWGSGLGGTVGSGQWSGSVPGLHLPLALQPRRFASKPSIVASSSPPCSATATASSPCGT